MMVAVNFLMVTICTVEQSSEVWRKHFSGDGFTHCDGFQVFLIHWCPRSCHCTTCDVNMLSQWLNISSGLYSERVFGISRSRNPCAMSCKVGLFSPATLLNTTSWCRQNAQSPPWVLNFLLTPYIAVKSLGLAYSMGLDTGTPCDLATKNCLQTGLSMAMALKLVELFLFQDSEPSLYSLYSHCSYSWALRNAESVEVAATHNGSSTSHPQVHSEFLTVLCASCIWRHAGHSEVKNAFFSSFPAP